MVTFTLSSVGEDKLLVEHPRFDDEFENVVEVFHGEFERHSGVLVSIFDGILDSNNDQFLYKFSQISYLYENWSLICL